MSASRRLRKRPAALEITAFLNLIVVLVPFLLSTAVFTRIAVLDLTLPPPNSGAAPEKLKHDTLQLEVVIRAEAIEVGDRLGGLIERIPRTPDGQDVRSLSVLVQRIKTRFPNQTDASVLAEPDTPYDTLVQVMDAVRAAPDGTRAELFPQIAIGDAPVKAAAKERT
ncbi:MAG: biopolymer transporter ExbD [Burkholderiales bacterium]|nr:biopolymer transporter ExbD [Burkholderiales bacterium]